MDLLKTAAKNEINNEPTDFSKKFFTDIFPHGTPETTAEFLLNISNMNFNYINTSLDRDSKILKFQFPQELKKKINLAIPKEGVNLEQIYKDCEMVMTYSVKTAHPRNFNQISQGLDMISLAGEWVTGTCNTNMFTYEVAPIFNLIERATLDKMAKLCGWVDHGDGLFAPGGSICNLYAAESALHYYFPETKENGLFEMQKLIIFTSAHGHYSMHRAAAILGLGLDNVRDVPVDESGRMLPEALDRMILECLGNNEVPFLVACTSGTTVLGAFDPIDRIAKVCKKYKLWLHVDAAWGGGALLSKKYKHLMQGIELADSVTWNPHKLMGALLQCSAFLIKKKGVLLSCNGMNATYLFQQDKHYDVNYDTGDKTIQCGRHVDAFKFWLQWRAKGDNGFEDALDKLWDLAHLLKSEIERRDNFEMVMDKPQFTNICFWYIPESLKSLEKDSEEYTEKLNEIAPTIKKKMMMKGTLMIGYQPLDDKPNFFRMIFSNQATKEEDVYFLLDEIEKLGCDL